MIPKKCRWQNQMELALCDAASVLLMLVGTQGEQSRVSFIQSYTLFAKEATLGNDRLAHPTVGFYSQVTQVQLNLLLYFSTGVVYGVIKRRSGQHVFITHQFLASSALCHGPSRSKWHIWGTAQLSSLSRTRTRRMD